MHMCLEKCTSRILVVMLLCYGSVALAADADQKAQPAKDAVSVSVKPAEPAQNMPDVVAKVNGTAIKAVDLRRAKKVMLSGLP